MASEKTPLTGVEVAKHNSEKDCWVIVHGRAYDVTEFLPGKFLSFVLPTQFTPLEKKTRYIILILLTRTEHPGGMKIILKYAVSEKLGCHGRTAPGGSSPR